MRIDIGIVVVDFGIEILAWRWLSAALDYAKTKAGALSFFGGARIQIPRFYLSFSCLEGMYFSFCSNLTRYTSFRRSLGANWPVGCFEIYCSSAIMFDICIK
jgi:hypothetical protein